MVQIEQDRNELRATDATKRSVTVNGDFVPAPSGPELPRAVDTSTAITATRIRFEQAFVVVENLDEGSRIELASDAGPITLPDAAHCIRVTTPVKAYLRFDGPAVISKPGFDAVVVEFGTGTDVTVGFRSQTKLPRESMTVPKSIDGVATALSGMATSHRTASPDRSFPSMRSHPPTVTFGDHTDLPASLREPTFPGKRPEFVAPADLGTLLAAAPLIHYTGAAVRIEPDVSPRLVANGEWSLAGADAGTDAGTVAGTVARTDTGTDTGTDHAASDSEAAIAATLRRIFSLDCLVRNVGPHGTDLAEASLLDRLSLDVERTYELPMAERIARYMRTDFDRVADDLPEWHLSMYLAPDFESVQSLPYLIYNLPQVFTPLSEPLDGSEWLSRSLDDFFRSRNSVSVDLSKPILRCGRSHGWLADDVPIDVFKALPEAFENRQRFYDRADERISIVAIVNEPEMSPEGEAAADIYRQRAAELDFDVTVHERLDSTELATVFEESHDLVHFIGHCEPDGLVCPDGHFTTCDIKESNAQTFFLNACGSYYEGLDLIRKGSVAGGVTFNKVLDNNAALVGTAFARLLVNGFAFEQAIKLARRRVMAGKDYVVVGDGTHELTQKEGLVTSLLTIEKSADGYRVLHDAYTPSVQGAIYQSHLQDDSVSQLYGTTRTFEVGKSQLREFLSLDTMPVIYEGDLQWSPEIVEKL